MFGAPNNNVAIAFCLGAHSSAVAYSFPGVEPSWLLPRPTITSESLLLSNFAMSEEDKTVGPLSYLNRGFKHPLMELQSTIKPPTGPLSPKPESPTTARPLDFDDEPQESGVTTSAPPSAATQPNATEAAPPKPPRPLSPRQQAENTLKEAFPTVEESVVKAVLMASNFDVERAFHALLGSCRSYLGGLGGRGSLQMY